MMYEKRQRAGLFQPPEKQLSFLLSLGGELNALFSEQVVKEKMKPPSEGCIVKGWEEMVTG